MKIGIISDIHGNYEALCEVTNYLERFCDSIFCLGDIVGYGPDPEKCVNLIQRRGYQVLAGNHEYATVGKMDYTFFHKAANESIKYSKDQLSRRSKDFLKNLDLQIEYENMTFSHATINNPSQWIYLSDSTIEAQFESLKTQIGFVGHTHLPIVYKKNNDEFFINKQELQENSKIKIESNAKYIFNVGSVGQPRDNQIKSTFAVYDLVEKIFTLERLDYNIDRTIKKVKYSSLPKELVTRLVEGR